MEPIITIIILATLIIATITDLKTREVPNWITYSLIFAGLGIRAIYSLVYSDVAFIIQGVFGFSVFLALAYSLFYAGQWGGGDSKLLMGLGALIGLKFNVDSFLIHFLINILLIGAVYSIIYSFVLTLLNPRRVLKKIRIILGKQRIIITKKIIHFSVAILLFLAFFFEPIQGMAFVILGLMLFTMFYLWVFIKAVETTCMLKLLPVSALTEGDWIVKNIVIKGKQIVGPKDLGISLTQINQLKKSNIKRVLVKQGIPFVPSFLIGFIITLIYGNLFFLLI